MTLHRAYLTPDATVEVEDSGNVVLVTPERRITITNVQEWINQLDTARAAAQLDTARGAPLARCYVITWSFIGDPNVQRTTVELTRRPGPQRAAEYIAQAFGTTVTRVQIHQIRLREASPPASPPAGVRRG